MESPNSESKLVRNVFPDECTCPWPQLFVRAMAAAHPVNPPAAQPVEISLDHDGALNALDCWIRTQDVNDEPGDGSPEFFEYLEQIGRDFPDSVVPPSMEEAWDEQPVAAGPPANCYTSAEESILRSAWEAWSQKVWVGVKARKILKP